MQIRRHWLNFNGLSDLVNTDEQGFVAREGLMRPVLTMMGLSIEMRGACEAYHVNGEPQYRHEGLL